MDTLAAFCLGVALCALLPQLAPWYALGPPLVALACALRFGPPTGRRVLWLLFALCLGLAWASVRAHWRQADALASSREGTVVTVDATVVSLAQVGQFATRFTLRLAAPPAGVPREVLASDYRRRDWPSGSRWRLDLRLRAPRVPANPHGFDAEAWAWSEGVLASATVGKAREALGEAAGPSVWLARLREHALARVRQQLGGDDRAALVAALALGAQGELSRATWRQMADTGVIHLVSISGVHVTMLAGLVGALSAALLRALRWQRLTPRVGAALCALLAATAYALLAGFALPTQRTVFALGAACLMLLSRRHYSPFQIWWSVLALSLLLDPFAVLAPGFWLSFGLVAALLWADACRLGVAGPLHRLLRAQWAILLLSSPALLYLFGQLPLVSPLANLLAIPWITLVVTPLALAGLFDPSGVLLTLAAWCAGVFLQGLALLAVVPLWTPPSVPWPLLGLALFGAAGLLIPWPWPQRLLCVGLLVPVFAWRPPALAPGVFEVRLLDVGQGLAVLIQTRSHQLLFDTGAGDAARVVLPQLRARGAAPLDVLLLSHHDSDHMGAAASLLAQWPVTRVLTGQPLAMRGDGIVSTPCQAGQSWVWDGVRFDVLAPMAGNVAPSDNAASCVLRVASWRHAVLLTGDLPQAGEDALIARYHQRLRATVLVLGHHGSRSASGARFLQTVAPQWALVSAGYRNRYRHPHPEVLARLRAQAIHVARTDLDGQLHLRIADTVTLTRYRAQAPRYWRAPSSE